jgi:hypothetical protein
VNIPLPPPVLLVGHLPGSRHVALRLKWGPLRFTAQVDPDTADAIAASLRNKSTLARQVPRG